MLGPSGFFLAAGPERAETDSNDIELIHSSEEGFSELYRICKNGRFFVYKALKKEFRGNLLYEELLNKDFNIGFSLSHIGICQYFAKISHPVVGNCIVMEWIDGCTLEELIRSGSIDSRLCRKIICEMCDALDYVHKKQIIHRDLKPENIMITYNGQNVKVIDFGLSDTDSYNTFKAPAGTRHYASPELSAGEQVDIRSDIWSLGVIINEISRKYRHVSGRCLQQDKEKRYGSVADIKADILKSETRNVIRTVILLFIVGIAAAVFFIMNGRKTETVNDATMEQPAITTEQPLINTETETDIPVTETKVTKQETKPAGRSSDTPPVDNIDVDELEQLFNDAAQSIL